MQDNLYIFDCEVLAYDWLFVFKEFATGQYTVIWNDNKAAIAFMENNPFLGGFNNHHYDDFILKGVLNGLSPESIKYMNDLIIVEGVRGWDIPMINGSYLKLETFDLMDDTQDGTSLKGFEAHLGIPIEETSVDFNIDRPLTEQERRRMEYYCKYDVDATEQLYILRQGYLNNKVAIGAKRGLTAREAMGKTNAKLTSIYLKAAKRTTPWIDEREYQYPDKLNRKYIPEEVFAFFDRLHDPEVEDWQIFGGYDSHGTKHKGSQVTFNIGDCQCVIGFGGIHGAIPNYVEEATETRSIRNKDVASYYPHLMTLPLSEGQQYGYCSRNIPSPQVFVDTLEERVKAKKSGDKVTANALKLVLNTTYGTMLNGKNGVAYNDLYDPLMGRSVCITGQLLLLELAEHVVAECKSAKIVQLNTDGIMVSLDNADEAKWQEITQEWQDRTGFELEEDYIQKIVQRDVNNYIEVPVGGGSPKLKGACLVRGVLTNDNIDFAAMGYPAWNNISGGAFKINNDYCIVSKAITDYFVNGTPPEQTINDCQDIMQFQIISKVGGKYSNCYQIVNGEKIEVQKVNRVYATKDLSKGTLYKKHAITGNDAKVPSLPAHCIVDNNNKLTIDAVDKSWYIKKAVRHINEFLGIKPPKKNTRKINALKKQALALFNQVEKEDKKNG